MDDAITKKMNQEQLRTTTTKLHALLQDSRNFNGNNNTDSLDYLCDELGCTCHDMLPLLSTEQFEVILDCLKPLSRQMARELMSEGKVLRG